MKLPRIFRRNSRHYVIHRTPEISRALMEHDGIVTLVAGKIDPVYTVSAKTRHGAECIATLMILELATLGIYGMFVSQHDNVVHFTTLNG